MTALAVDTSVAVPLLVQTHSAHASVVRCGTDARSRSAVTPSRLLRARFVAPLQLKPKAAARLPEILGELGIAGGAVYDALVALAAAEHDAELATRDARATATYEAVGVRVITAGD